MSQLQPSHVPDSTAVRVALWRALHLECDDQPHIFEDRIGLALANPPSDWRNRPDMHPQGTKSFRASIVARARFVEDLLETQVKNGLTQFVILGAGLDTFALRRTDLLNSLHVFEIDKPETQSWKRNRIEELEIAFPKNLAFVPSNFETEKHWWEQLKLSGFKLQSPTFITSLGVSMYLSREAATRSLQQLAKLSPGSTVVMTFMYPLSLVDAEDRPGYERSLKGAQASGTPFLSFFSPSEFHDLARESGFKEIHILSTAGLKDKYFTNRNDGLYPSSGEGLMVATT